MELVLCRDIVSVPKLAQPLCMFARTTILWVSRRNVGKSTQIWRIWSALFRPICPRNEATSSGGAKGEIEAILSLEQQYGFVVDRLRVEILSLIAIFPGINRFLVQQNQLIYLITNFSGEAEEVRKHVALHGAVGASFAVGINQRLLVRLWVTGIHKGYGIWYLVGNSQQHRWELGYYVDFVETIATVTRKPLQGEAASTLLQKSTASDWPWFGD